MLSLDDFSPVTLDSKEAFDAHYKKYPPVHSDYVFTTMVSWKEYTHYEYTIVDDALCIKTNVDGIAHFRPPMGKHSKELFDEVLALSKKEDSTILLSMVTDDVKHWMETQYGPLPFESIPKYEDYVYRSEDLAQLKGSDFRKIRNRLNKFVKNVDFEQELISEDSISEVKKFLKRWCIWKDCEDDPLLTYEKKAVMFSADHFTELGLSGVAIRVNDRIEAVAMFEKMNPDMVVVHFEKGSPYFDGIYKLVNRETARLVAQDVQYINRESDMGNPGLRKAKKSYRPDHMVHVYNLNKDRALIH